MGKIKKKACPAVHSLEAYVSKRLSSGSDRQKVAHHINACPRCHAIASELYQYYMILEQEKNRPVSHSVFKLVDDLERDDVVIAGILLQPHDPKENNQSLKFRAEIVLTTQTVSTTDLDELDCIPVEENEIFIRAIQSLVTNETTLFLYANNPILYRNVQLQIESSPVIFLSDEIGKIELGCCEIDSLDEQHFVITTENFFNSIR